MRQRIWRRKLATCEFRFDSLEIGGGGGGEVVALMTPFFYVLYFLILFRVDPLEEEIGLDISHHRGGLYNLEGPKDEQIQEWRKKDSKYSEKDSPSPGASIDDKNDAVKEEEPVEVGEEVTDEEPQVSNVETS